jgi:hypothetical protein
METSIELNGQQHVLSVKRNFWTGSVNVELDGVKVTGKLNLVGGRKEIRTEIGESPARALRLVADIPVLFAWAREWPVELFLDDELLESFSLKAF